MTTAALVLAGGRGSRMGAVGPKPLVRLGGRTLLERVLDAVPDEIRTILIAGREGAGLEAFGFPLVPDARPGFAGPLAGIEAAAGSAWLQASGATHLLVLPGDTPFLTTDVLRALWPAPACVPRVARWEGRLQPTVALWPLPALTGLSAFLDSPARHAIGAYLDRTGYVPVDIGGSDPFFNVNTPADLDAAERRLSPSSG